MHYTKKTGEKMSKIGKILKIVLIVAMISVFALLAINIFKSDNKELEALHADSDAFKSAYALSRNIRTHTPDNDGFSENGGVYAYSLYYIEDAGYLQITVRYNKKHLDDVQSNYADFDESKIHYTLTDEAGSTYTPSIIDSAEKYHYKYFKLEFTGIDFKDATLKLNMVIDVLNDVIGEKSSVVLHKFGQASAPVELQK